MRDMARQLASLRSLLPEFESALKSFASSSQKFRVVRSINPVETQPATLYILDSSFNPPSVAHLTLATSALRDHAPSEHGPYRLLLLFSTHNADKAPSPSSFVQRLALMTAFAEDISESLRKSTQSSDETVGEVTIDVALTKEPYYTDKSAAISEANPPFYTRAPIHVHLVGYDTLIRFCNPKYYPKHQPPLSALKPFFDSQHKLRVTQRPANADDESSNDFGSVEAQQKYLQDLKEGSQAWAGFESDWGGNIDMAQADDGVGISSTRVRDAARAGRWEEVGQLCTPGVAAWIKDQGLYSEQQV
ncbi:Nucleotidylyl transferase [Pyrenochaeta sp. DS3sAY3a]|nr:Nucleotidylyl transferase [Pyrenochaeta sp. DS3sAY3a]